MMLSSDNGRSLVIWKTLFSPRTPMEDVWLCTCILDTTCTVKDHRCHFDCGWRQLWEHGLTGCCHLSASSRFWQRRTPTSTCSLCSSMGKRYQLHSGFDFFFQLVDAMSATHYWIDLGIMIVGSSTMGKKIPSPSIKIIKKVFWVHLPMRSYQAPSLRGMWVASPLCNSWKKPIK